MKDPAFLFYSSDFLTGTYTMSNEQVGMYIRLLCLQHSKGPLSEKDMMKICNSHDEDIFSKFENVDGMYTNKRLMDESERRRLYSESRRKNRKTEKDIINTCKSYVPHMETVTIDSTISSSIQSTIPSIIHSSIQVVDCIEEYVGCEKKNESEKKMIVPLICEIWYEKFPFYTKSKEDDYPAAKKIAEFLQKLMKESVYEKKGKEEALEAFARIAQVIKEPSNQFWQTKPLKTIANNLQNFISQIKNPNKNGKSNSKKTVEQQRSDLQAELARRGDAWG